MYILIDTNTMINATLNIQKNIHNIVGQHYDLSRSKFVIHTASAHLTDLPLLLAKPYHETFNFRF